MCTDKLLATVITPSGEERPCQIIKNPDGTFTIKFISESSGRHHLCVKYKTHKLSDFYFDVKQKPTVNVYGPAVEQDVYQKKEMMFNVDCKDAGTGWFSF